MDISYDYVEIVIDDDWKLFGIIPHPNPPFQPSDKQMSATVVNTPNPQIIAKNLDQVTIAETLKDSDKNRFIILDYQEPISTEQNDIIPNLSGRPNNNKHNLLSGFGRY